MAKTIALWGIAFLLLLQTVQIEISTPSAIDPKREIDAPKEIIKMLKVSCYRLPLLSNKNAMVRKCGTFFMECAKPHQKRPKLVQFPRME